jgi:hypothetical protein
MICISCGTPLEEDISCRILGGKIFRKCATIDVLYIVHRSLLITFYAIINFCENSHAAMPKYYIILVYGMME